MTKDRALIARLLMVGVPVLLPTLALMGCAHHSPSWTPESVRPPEDIRYALEATEDPATPTDDSTLETTEMSPEVAVEDPEDIIWLGERAIDPATPLMTPPAAPGETIEVSRDGVILSALANNRSLAVSRFGPQIASTLRPEARSAFDPTLLATVSHGRSTEQIGGISRFTVGQAAGGFGPSFVPELSPIQQLLAPDPLVEFLEQAQTIENTVSALIQDGRRIIYGPQELAFSIENSDTEVRVVNYFPTGTEVFLAGGVSRFATDFTPSEYTGRWDVGITQSLLRGAGRNVNLVSLRQAENTAAQSEHEFRSMLMDTVTMAENAYWGLVLADEMLRIQEFSVNLAEQQRERNKDLVEVGIAIQGTVIAADAEVSSRRADLIDAQAMRKEQSINLVRVLNPDISASGWDLLFSPQDPPEIGAIPLQPDDSARLGQQYRPELAQARLELANRELDVVRTKNGLLPRLDAFAQYGRTSLADSASDFATHLDSSDYDNYAVGINFQMPILNRGERARHLRAQFQEERAKAAIFNLEQMLEVEVRQACIEVERQWERHQATQAAVRAREEELRIEEDRYSVGMSTNLDVLQIQRNLIAAQVAEVTARVDYIRALTQLYRAEGTLLERRGIALEAHL